MATKKDHLEYIKSKGKFILKCRHSIFSEEEIALLEKYGHWFQALTDNLLEPFNNEQKQFIEVANRKIKAETFEEKVWFKYLKRKEIEEKHGDILNHKPALEDDTFFSRDMAKSVRKTMFGVMSKNHRS